jgi:ribosome-associated protein
MATPETRRQLLAAVAACDDKKGEDTRILELDPADSGLADFFLITSATNDRQVVAIADEIEMRLKKEFGVYPASVEGRRQAEWILLDYVDIVIHVFLQEKRAFYDIERLRKSARTLTAGEIDAQLGAELRSALSEKTRAVRKSAKTPQAQKRAAKVSPGKSPATKATKPKTPSAHTSLKGESQVTAKPAKKAASKAAAKSTSKPGAKAKVTAKASAPKVAAKPALKSAKNVSAAKPVGALAPRPVRSPGKGGAANLGAQPPIVKCEDPDAPGVVGARFDSNAVVGAQPPIVKCEDPDAPSSVSLAASTASKAAKKPAKKAAKAPAKTPAKAPLKQAIRKRSK